MSTSISLKNPAKMEHRLTNTEPAQDFDELASDSTFLTAAAAGLEDTPDQGWATMKRDVGRNTQMAVRDGMDDEG